MIGREYHFCVNHGEYCDGRCEYQGRHPYGEGHDVLTSLLGLDRIDKPAGTSWTGSKTLACVNVPWRNV